MSNEQLKRIPSDKQVALWFCGVCGNSGSFLVEGCNVYALMELLSQAHKDVSKGLCATVTPTVIRPSGWYAEVLRRTEQ